MALTNTSGDVWVPHTQIITAGANLADKTLITQAGAAVVSAALGTYGVIRGDVASGDYATVKIAPCIVEVLCTGTVTQGILVEALTGAVYANIAGTSTSTTSSGVSTIASGYAVGKALTTSAVYGTALISVFSNTSLKPV